MVYILLCDGFEESEAIVPCDLLRRAGIETAYVGVEQKNVTGSMGTKVEADLLLDQADVQKAEMVVIPGGRKGVRNLMESEPALQFALDAWHRGAYLAAICAGPTVLAHLGITDGKQVTCYPDSQWTQQMSKAVYVSHAATIRDGRVITGRSAGCAVSFGLELVRALRGEEVTQQVRSGIALL